VEIAGAVSFGGHQRPWRRSSRPQGDPHGFQRGMQPGRRRGSHAHDVRHAMGRHFIENTSSIEAVQRQLGHTNAAYSIQHARVTDQELVDELDDR